MTNAMQVARGLLARMMRFCMAAAFVGASAQAHAGISFRVAVATHNEPAAGSSNVPPDETLTSQVVLGERSMSVTTGERASVFDFAGRRRYEIDLKAGTYVNYSLFDGIGFRVMELQNRAYLGRALAAAKIERAMLEPVYDEQVLSLASRPARSLAEAADGADTVLSVDGKPLMRIGAGGAAVGAGDAAAFVQYLRYHFGGHPLVLAKLAALGRIPPRFVMYYRAVGHAATRTFTIGAVTAAKAPAYELARFAERNGGADEIDQLLDRARRAAMPAQDAQRARFDAEVADAFADKRALDAMLGAVEWMLMSGARMQAFSAEQTAVMQADPAVRAVTAAMNPRDKAGLRAAVATMQSMRAQTMRKRHMLMLFEANDRAQLGEPAAALTLFASVLRANPALAGAYKDMGDTLFQGFDMPRAWRSWDEGRRIAPSLNLFDAVNQFEQTLLRDHPEYF